MQAAALGWLGIAAYLYLRERNLTRALVVADTLLALSLFSHPHALTIFVLLWLAIVVLDGKRLRFYQLALSALPFLLGLTGWIWFITRDYQAFHDQFFGNARGRFSADGGVLGMLRRELQIRYLNTFLGNDTLVGVGRLKVLILVGYAAGVLGAIALPSVRASLSGPFPARRCAHHVCDVDHHSMASRTPYT